MKALKLSKLLIVLSSLGLVLSGCSFLPNMEPPSKPQEQTDDKDDEHKDDEKKTYTVTWKNWDGSVLEIDTDVPDGTLPTYDGMEPTKPNDDYYTYSFNGWYPNIRNVHSDQTYNAKFYSTPIYQPINTYIIEWKNWDGEMLEVDYDVPEGTWPTYNGPTPFKPSDDFYDYNFNGWSPSLHLVNDNQTYDAVFNAVLRHVHTFSSEWSYDEYNHWHAATCGHDLTSDMSAHTFGEWITDSESTTEEHGQKHRTCSVCGYEETEELPLVIVNDERFDYYETIGGYGVSGLKDEYKDLEEVVIPRRYNGELIVEIGHHSFSDNRNIKSVTISNSLERIDHYAFFKCVNLERVIIPEDSALKEINERAFWNCDSLREFNIPDALTSISDGTFSNCWSLFRVNISPSSSIKQIGRNAFDDCPSLTSITLPPALEYIGEEAFNGCMRLCAINNLSSLNIQKGSEDFGKVALNARCVANDQSPIIEIDNNGFAILNENNEKTLVNYVGTDDVVNIPTGVNRIAQFAFYGLKTYYDNEFLKTTDHVKIRKIIVPEGVTTIEPEAFESLESLLEVTLPSTLVSYDDSSIVACSKLTEVVNKSDLELPSNGWSFIKDESETSIVNDNGFLIKNNICIAYIGEQEQVTIPNGVTAISNDAFIYNQVMKQLTIPESVNYLGYRAFYCSNIQTVSLPDSISTIFSSTFELCEKLQSIDIPNSVTSIGVCAFSNCQSLQNINFDEESQLQTIEDAAFQFCNSLEEISIGKNVSSIGGLTNLPNLKNINVNEDNEYYSSIDGVLYNKDQTALIRVPESKAFDTSTIPATVTTIKSNCFYHCYQIETLVIPDGIKILETDSLFALNNTNAFVIPTSIETIGGWCFTRSGNEMTYTYLGTIEQWNNIDIDGSAFVGSYFVIHCLDGDIVLPNNP